MSDLKSLQKVARKHGWRVELRRAGHLVWASPNREIPLIFSPATPSGGVRSIENLKARLRGAGLPV